MDPIRHSGSFARGSGAPPHWLQDATAGCWTSRSHDVYRALGERFRSLERRRPHLQLCGGAFFSRFVFGTDETNNLKIRCCKNASSTFYHEATCVTGRPFTNARGNTVIGCSQAEDRSITEVVFGGASTEVTSVKCCRQVATRPVTPTALSVILYRPSTQLDVRSASEFAFQNVRPSAPSMLTGFQQPASAHTRDIGIWQWSHFNTAHLATPDGTDVLPRQSSAKTWCPRFILFSARTASRSGCPRLASRHVKVCIRRFLARGSFELRRWQGCS